MYFTVVDDKDVNDVITVDDDVKFPIEEFVNAKVDVIDSASAIEVDVIEDN